MNTDRPRRRLREILARAACVTASSVLDPISARIADSVGFEVGLMGGSVASFAVLGDAAPSNRHGVASPELMAQFAQVAAYDALRKEYGLQ